MAKMVKKLKKYKNLRISILKSEPVPPFSHTNFASHNRRTSSLELALCMSFSKFFDIDFLVNLLDYNPRFGTEWTLSTGLL